MVFKVYIPARYAATRLPGKLLLCAGGKTILESVYKNASASGAAEVIIATDDERIAECAQGFGATVVYTSPTHVSGTDRIAEAAAMRAEEDNTIIVNVQGDEPQLPGGVMRQVAALLATHPAADIATICEPLTSAAEVKDPNVVKVVRGGAERALYFSRAAIPFSRNDKINVASYRRHVGIYAYRVGYLRHFVALPPSELEMSERLEQLRALADGASIVVADACQRCGLGVDTAADLARLRAQVAQDA